jgi:hypothetical protein
VGSTAASAQNSHVRSWVEQVSLRFVAASCSVHAVITGCIAYCNSDKFSDCPVCRNSARTQTTSDARTTSLIGGMSLAPRAPCTARSVQRTPRTARQLETEQADGATGGAMLRARIMQGMGEQERVLLLKALSGF